MDLEKSCNSILNANKIYCWRRLPFNRLLVCHLYYSSIARSCNRVCAFGQFRYHPAGEHPFQSEIQPVNWIVLRAILIIECFCWI